jgi:hypothetical protein
MAVPHTSLCSVNKYNVTCYFACAQNLQCDGKGRKWIECVCVRERERESQKENWFG